MPVANQRAVWEKEEIERSVAEAANTTELRRKLFQITRYMDPPAGTPYALEYAFRLLADVRGRTVLDFGCGSGENTLLLLKRQARVIALDISGALVEVAKKRLEVNGVTGDVRFVVASGHELPLPDNSVDVVFGIAILHHLDMRLASKQVWRVLKPGGRAIFQEPMRTSKLLQFARKLIPYQQPDVSPFERPLNEQDISILTSEFASYAGRDFQLPHVRVARILPFKQELAHSFYRLDRKLLDRYPALGRYATIRVMELVK
jgi:SAM-dependent methyltransferase